MKKALATIKLLLITFQINSYCPTGYEDSGGDGQCSDIDECGTAKHNCDSNAECTNSDGSFSCECKSGFTGDGVQCLGEVSIRFIHRYKNPFLALEIK